MRQKLTTNKRSFFFTTKAEREPPVNMRHQANEYFYEGYRIHETFDPDGPSFSDCIVRLFTG